MNSNYASMQKFLDTIKQFAINNPEKGITSNFVYSNLIRFNLPSIDCEEIEYYDYWKKIYSNNKNIKVFEIETRKHFLWFTNGEIKGNEIKLYIPMDKEHIKLGANQLFDFIASKRIQHESKIADYIRNDNLVIRVNNLEDAQTIVEYVSSNNYIKEGLLEVNPFLPKCNNIGITMDNTYSYNSVVSSIIAYLVFILKEQNKLQDLNVDMMNKYIISQIPNVKSLDLKDIYKLVAKTTSPNFVLTDFVIHAKDKLVDKYNEKRERMVNPKFYFEQAIFETKKKYKGNEKIAILEYLKGKPNFFTNDNNARDGLIKYVRPGDLINIMRTELDVNDIPIPQTDDKLIDEYLNVLNKTYLEYGFDVIKNAYYNTAIAYSKNQADCALEQLLLNNNTSLFTNKNGDRAKLNGCICYVDIKKIVLNKIDLYDLKSENMYDMFKRFSTLISQDLINNNKNANYSK